MKRVGLIAQMINSGIGTQSWEFARYMKPEKVLITDLTDLHEAAGKKIKNYPTRFADFNTRTTVGYPNTQDLEWLCEDVDVIFFIETVLNWGLLPIAKRLGIKTIGQYNYELIDKLDPLHESYPVPDEMWMPSSWYYNKLLDQAKDWGCEIQKVEVPVNREVLPFDLKRQARTFLHIAGHSTLEDRNGTDLVLSAIPLVKNPNVRFVIRTQHDLPELDDDRMRYARKEVNQYWEAFEDADVLLLPRRYGGLTLQRNEALSRGMPVIMPDIPPQTGEMPQEWLVPATYQKTIHTRPDIDIYEVSPEDLAAKIDYFSSLSPFTMSSFSLKADMMAREIDWKVMEPIYRALLEEDDIPEPTVPEEELTWT